MISKSKIRKAAKAMVEREIETQLSKLFPMWAKVEGTNRGKYMKRKSVTNGNSNGEVKAKAKPARSRVLAGKYMGIVRQLTKDQKKEIRVIREAKGFRAAIAEAKRMKQAQA